MPRALLLALVAVSIATGCVSCSVHQTWELAFSVSGAVPESVTWELGMSCPGST